MVLGVSNGRLERTPVVHLRELLIFVVQYQVAAGPSRFPSGRLRITKGMRTLYGAPLRIGTWVDGSPILYRTLRPNSTRYLGHLVARLTLKLRSQRASRSINLTVVRRLVSY